ncbi:MAG: prohibitin family protein [Candidatus Altiarchaeota archaeon]|nr:prohibitin family protein [Candidatus Altiarchaeota archaeon]
MTAKFDEPMSPALRLLIGLIAAVIFVTLLRNCYFIVGPGERGVLMTFGEVAQYSYTEGIHVKMPLVQSVVIINIKTQKMEDTTEASSKDMQIVNTAIALNYHISPDAAQRVFQEIGPGYELTVIDPAIKESVKAITAQFTAEELITKRDDVAVKIRESISQKLAPRYILVETMSITNFQFSRSFNDAIEAKVTAEQLKLKADRDLERIRVEANQTVIRAKAEAEAISIRAEALKQNEKLIPLTIAEKWDGHLPKVMVNGGGSNMLFDISTYANEETSTEP